MRELTAPSERSQTAIYSLLRKQPNPRQPSLPIPPLITTFRMALEKLSSNKAFGGELRKYKLQVSSTSSRPPSSDAGFIDTRASLPHADAFTCLSYSPSLSRFLLSSMCSSPSRLLPARIRPACCTTSPG